MQSLLKENNMMDANPEVDNLVNHVDFEQHLPCPLRQRRITYINDCCKVADYHPNISGLIVVV